MDLELTEEQVWLRESVDELLARAAGDDGIVPDAAAERVWSELVEFGALATDGDDEGLGAVELSLVAWSIGSRLAPVGYVDAAALAYVAPGHGRTALCLGEPARSFAPTEPTTLLEDGRLLGEKASVTDAAAAERLAVTATGEDGLALLEVPLGAAGMTIEPEPTLDPSLRPGRVRFDGVEARSLHEGPETAALVESLAAAAAVLAAAEAVGAASEVLRRAATYAGERRQFGRTIGSFQAVRHLLADMYVKVESSWSSVLYAAAALDEQEVDTLRTASIAKAYAGRATHEVAHGALQVFGGVAFTAEHPAHRFLRRIAVRSFQFGTPREHERRLGRELAQRLEVRV